MKISVITVVYNGEATIEETILSVHEQSYGNIEHIIVDGASTDNTMSIVKRHSDKISCYISEPDTGMYDAMNKGIDKSSGDIVGFLNSDDVYAGNEVLEKIHDAISKSGADACYGDLVYISNGNNKKIVRYWRSQDYVDGLCRRGWMPAHPTFYVRRETYRKHGVFSLNYKFQSDYEMSLRLLDVNNIQVAYIPEVLIKMRMGGVSNNSITNIIKGNIEAYRACKKYFPDTSLMFIPRKIISRLGQFISKPKAV